MRQLATQRAAVEALRHLVGEPRQHTLAHRDAVEALLGHVEAFLRRDLQERGKQRPHRPRALRVDTQAAARIRAVVGLVREAPRPHEQKEVALHLLAENLVARIVHRTRQPALQKTPPLRERRHQRHRAHTPARIRLQQHARIARVHRKPQHATPNFGDLRKSPALRRECAEIRQQHLRPLQRLRLRFFQPWKTRHIVNPARLQGQHHLAQIQPLHLGQLLRRAARVLALRPQSHAAPGRGAARATRTLVGAGPRDFFHQQGVDAAVGVELRLPRQPRIHHDSHAVNGQRGLRHVGRDDDLARTRPGHRAVLRFGREFAVQRQHHAAVKRPMPAERLHRAADLIRPWHKHQKISRRLRRHPRTLARRHLPDRVVFEVHRFWQILDRHRITPPLRGQDLTGGQVVRQHRRIERRRHYHDQQIRPRRPLDLQRPRQRDVAVKMTLVKLIKHQRRHALEPRVERHLPEQNPLRHEAHSRFRRHPRLQPYLVTDLLPEFAAHLFRHPPRQHARCQSPRLQHHHFACGQKSVFAQHLRDLGGLARTGRRLHHDPARRPKRTHQIGFQFVDG